MCCQISRLNFQTGRSEPSRRVKTLPTPPPPVGWDSQSSMSSLIRNADLTTDGAFLHAWRVIIARCWISEQPTWLSTFAAGSNKKVSCRKQIARQQSCDKKIGQGRDEVDHENIFLSSRLITMQNLVAICHTVWALCSNY